MLNLKSMQAKVDKMLSVFTKLEAELETQIEVLDKEIEANDKKVAEINHQSAEYAVQIDKYNVLKYNIGKFLGKE
ncbi:MAG: hypothetical protein IKB62_01170 [Oscillospiraceae bacterium]|nr:hypothetical protein [Oscillospiraceae bacterium]